VNGPALRRILLGLFCTDDENAQLRSLTGDDWAILDGMAAQHRLQPLLHHRHNVRATIPQAIRDGWRAAYRQAAMDTLPLQIELAETIALLEAAGFAPIALKGAWLAWHAYPQAALRPMRDLDLLVTPETVLAAYDVLLAAGYTLAEESEMALADVVQLEKHMPPLNAPRGTRIELHHRLWEPDGRLDHATPDGCEDAVRARAIRLDGITFPAPQDMLVHLIVHAAYSHRLDCGPVVLADLHYFLAGHTIDWREFWTRAQREGWHNGARLLLELASQFAGTLERIEWFDNNQPLPSALITAAQDLLLQNLDTRRSAGVMAAARSGGGAALLRRLRGQRISQSGESATRDMTIEGGFLGWAWSRTRRTIGELGNSDVRRQSRELARLSNWLGH